MESLTWRAALAASVDPTIIAAMSQEQFLAALREQLAALGRKKGWRRIAVAVQTAAGAMPVMEGPRCPAPRPT